MTTPNYPASPGYAGAPVATSATTGPGTGEPSTRDAAKEQAQQTAGTAADETKHVAGVAMGEAKQVAGEAKQQAQSLMDEARSQVDAQSRTQRDRLVSTLQEFSGQLDGMARGEGAPSGMAHDAVREVADRARELSSRLDGREPSDLIEDVRAFARRKPGTFLLGAVAAGLVAGRLTRGAKAASSPETADVADFGADPLIYEPLPTSAGAPLAATSYPETDLGYPVDGDSATVTVVQPGVSSEPFDPAPTTAPVTGTDRPGPDVTSNRTPL